MTPRKTATPPPKASSNREIKYACTNCGAEPGRENLTVKKVEWATMGMKFKRLRVRTVAWLCNECREKDPAWKQEDRAGAPGSADWKKDDK